MATLLILKPPAKKCKAILVVVGGRKIARYIQLFLVVAKGSILYRATGARTFAILPLLLMSIMGSDFG